MKKIIIIGGGVAGKLLIQDILDKKLDYKIVGVIDDNLEKNKNFIKNVPVLGKIDEISGLLETYHVDEIIIAIPSERGKVIRKIILLLSEIKSIELRLLPRTSDIVLGGKVSIDDIRQIDISDLVGESIPKKDQQKIEESFENQIVMVSGGGGSIGSELTKQIFLSRPKKVIVIDSCEKNLFYVGNLLRKLKEVNGETETELILGDIKNLELIESIFDNNKITSLFHAAAYKHVPILEENPFEATNNNIYGTYNLCLMAGKHKVEKFILISTDKAVNPVNIMGKTKRATELVLQYFNNIYETNYAAVRFGNVFNSSGSAVEVFLNQIENGYPITITNPEMTRYFLTIPEAVHLVLQAWFLAVKNSIFMLEMGEPVNILDLAKCLAAIKGKKNMDVDIQVIGERIGEKKHEILFDNQIETKTPTEHKKIYSITCNINVNFSYFESKIKDLFKLLELKYVKNHSEEGKKTIILAVNDLIKVGCIK